MSEFLQILFRTPPGSEPLAWHEVLLYLMLAFILGQVVAWTYYMTHKGLSYARSQVQSLVLMSVIVTAVMLAVGNNVARAFGLFGALALIRFRTPVKDTRDTTFLFLSVLVGIALGTRNVTIAVTGTGMACLVAGYLSLSRFGEKRGPDAVLRFAMQARDEQEGLLRQTLQHYCKSFALVHLREAGPDALMDFAYQVKLYDPAQSTGLLQDMGMIPGLSGLNLILQSEDEEI